MLLPLLFAITLHEVAHGWVASLLGDDTARKLGRISLNPFKHIDLLGTLIVPLLMYVSTGFIFGWAKPVPVDFGRLHHPRRDMALVALAGPGANLLMMLFWGLLARLGAELHSTGWDWAALPLVYAGGFGLMINAVLMVLNLFPLPPLDGGRVLVSLLPRPLAIGVSKLEPYGIIILVILLFTGLLWQLVGPLVSASQQGMAILIETLT
ncbi:MAG: site-2 protease family protein [Gammaproteobacteria bacterium]|nr:site-2 protease family protein [Gammaproteobacteria bacterium]